MLWGKKKVVVVHEDTSEDSGRDPLNLGGPYREGVESVASLLQGYEAHNMYKLACASKIKEECARAKFTEGLKRDTLVSTLPIVLEGIKKLASRNIMETSINTVAPDNNYDVATLVDALKSLKFKVNSEYEVSWDFSSGV